MELSIFMKKYPLLVTILMFAYLIYDMFNTIGQTTWMYDQVLSMGLILIVYYFRSELHMGGFQYTLLLFILLLHNLGSFGFYSNSYFGLEYDVWVHFLWGVCGYLIFYNFHAAKNSHSIAFFMAFVSVMALSGVHEVLEFAGMNLFGQGEGVLFYGYGDMGSFDTEWDLTNALIGSLLISPFVRIYSYVKDITPQAKTSTDHK